MRGSRPRLSINALAWGGGHLSDGWLHIHAGVIFTNQRADYRGGPAPVNSRPSWLKGARHSANFMLTAAFLMLTAEQSASHPTHPDLIGP